MRLSAPRVLIDINGIDELKGFGVDAGRVRIGALVRHRELERSEAVARHLPLIRQAMPHVAHAAVRNRGTFGGSIAYADPAAELPACSLALGATFHVASREGTRNVAAGEFFKGLYETALGRGEVLTGAELPALAPGYRSVFVELARRHGDFAIVGLAAHAKYENGRFDDVRLAYFGVGATPVLAKRAAAVLENGNTSDTVRDAQEAIAHDLAPFDDVHHSAAARLHLARVLLGRAVSALRG